MIGQVAKRKSEAGQAALLVVLAMGIFLIGATGLAVDGSHMYAQRQMAQAAADAAAQAGILSIFDGSNSVVGNGHGFATSNFTCATNDARTPCYYAQTMNGFNVALTDTVKVDFPTASAVGVPTGTLSTSDPVNLLRVTVQRKVSTTFMGLLGPKFSTISASGTAAIVMVQSPVPIIVTHPSLTQAFMTKGTGSAPKIKICGGPRRSIQVNSSDAHSLYANGSGVINLYYAGPQDSGNCTVPGGADFGDWGGPSTAPFTLTEGPSNAGFLQPASPIRDPLASVVPPSAPSVNGVLPASGTTLAAGSNGCPATASGGCKLVFPGTFTSDLKVKNQSVVFAPGIYYMNGSSFTAAANGNMYYATGLVDSGTGQTITNCCGTATGWGSAGGTPPNAGILVYLTGPSGTQGNATGTISVSSNSNVNLVGSPNNSSFKGMLFFVDRFAAAATHNLDGGGGLTLTGTIYMPEDFNVMNTPATSSHYQLLHFQGTAGSSTLLTGEIITSAILLEGTPGIVMNLNPFASAPVRQIALVN